MMKSISYFVFEEAMLVVSETFRHKALKTNLSFAGSYTFILRKAQVLKKNFTASEFSKKSH